MKILVGLLLCSLSLSLQAGVFSAIGLEVVDSGYDMLTEHCPYRMMRGQLLALCTNLALGAAKRSEWQPAQKWARMIEGEALYKNSLLMGVQLFDMVHEGEFLEDHDTDQSWFQKVITRVIAVAWIETLLGMYKQGADKPANNKK